MNLNRQKGGGTQLLFILLLLFSFGICALFTILIGAQVYENIGKRMESNFSDATVLSYVSNKIRQADESDMVSVDKIDGISVLKLSRIVEGKPYDTSIYYMDGKVKELFCARDSGLTLADGLDILDSKGLDFEMVNDNLLSINSYGKQGGQIYLALRSDNEAEKSPAPQKEEGTQ